MPLARKSLTPKELEARRANARKSTGPQTVKGKQRSRLNALRTGLYARSLVGSMRALGEREEEYQRLLRDLMDAHQPGNAAERMLVEDLAALRWQKIRCQRGQAGKLVSRLEKLETDRKKASLEIGRQRFDTPQVEVVETGLRRMPDSVGKFKKLLECLDTLRAVAQERMFTKDGLALLATIYGNSPTLRGSEIINMFLKLMEGPEDAKLREMLCRDLQLAVLEDASEATEEYQVYLRELVEITPAMRDACLAPSEDEWRLMIRQESAIDRQIERKTKLLMQIQKEREAKTKIAVANRLRGKQDELGALAEAGLDEGSY